MVRLHFLPIPFVLVFLGLGLLAAFLIVLLKACRSGRWILLGLLVIPGLLLGFRVLSHSRPVVPGSAAERPLTDFEVPSQGSMEDYAVWQDNLEKELVPDTYSTLQRAAYGLGTQMQETIEEATERPPARIRIVEINLSKTDLTEFRNGLKTHFGQAEITFGPREEGFLSEDAIFVSLENHEEDDHPIHLRQSDSSEHTILLGNVRGVLEATVESTKGNFFKGVSYDTRPWLWDLSKFQSHMPQGRWLVAASEEPATSLREAAGQALGKAAEALSLQIQNANPTLSIGRITPEDLIRKGLIVDDYSQKLAGMAGPIWRHAVLLDVSPQRLQSLVSAKAQVVRVRRSSLLRQFVSLGGMILLVIVVYLLANAATKGYYSMVLAVSAVAAAVIIGIIILNYA